MKTYSRLGKRQRLWEQDDEQKRRRVMSEAPMTYSTALDLDLPATMHRQANAIDNFSSEPESSFTPAFSGLRSSPSSPVPRSAPASSPPSSPPIVLASRTSSPEPISVCPSKLSKQHDMKPRPPLVQMQLNLGPCLQKTCRDCGMTWVQSSADDIALHSKFHQRHLEGSDVGKPFRKYAEENAIWIGPSSHLIVVVDGASKSFERRKVQQILAIAQAELGAVDIPEGELWRMGRDGDQSEAISADVPRRQMSCYRAFVYLAGLRCVGLCLAKTICDAQRVLPLASDHEGLCISDEKYPARIGISRIWVSKAHRRHGIAKRLLDNVQSRFLDGIDVPKEFIAFSQPTTSGAKLASSWHAKQHGWPVYID